MRSEAAKICRVVNAPPDKPADQAIIAKPGPHQMSAMDASLIFRLISQIIKTEEATIMAGMKSITVSMALSNVVSNS